MIHPQSAIILSLTSVQLCLSGNENAHKKIIHGCSVYRTEYTANILFSVLKLLIKTERKNESWIQLLQFRI